MWAACISALATKPNIKLGTWLLVSTVCGVTSPHVTQPCLESLVLNCITKQCPVAGSHTTSSSSHRATGRIRWRQFPSAKIEQCYISFYLSSSQMAGARSSTTPPPPPRFSLSSHSNLQYLVLWSTPASVQTSLLRAVSAHSSPPAFRSFHIKNTFRGF